MSNFYTNSERPCCQSGCEDCPWGYAEEVDPLIPAELNHRDPTEEEDELLSLELSTIIS